MYFIEVSIYNLNYLRVYSPLPQLILLMQAYLCCCDLIWRNQLKIMSIPLYFLNQKLILIILKVFRINYQIMFLTIIN